MSEKNGSNGPTQDATTGQFVKGGGGGPGRKPGIKVSFRTAARKRAEEMDIDLDKEVGTLALLLLKRAKEGDVHAAKFVVERLCGLLKQELDVTSTTMIITADESRQETLDMMANGGEEALNDRIRGGGDG